MISEAIRNDFGKNVEAALRIIFENRYITALELAEKLGKSSRTVKNYISSGEVLKFIKEGRKYL